LANWCGDAPLPVLRPQLAGPELVVIPLRGLELEAGHVLRLIGSRPVVFAVRGNVSIGGLIDAGGQAGTPGAGGDHPADGPIATAGGEGADCNIEAAGTGQGRRGGSWSVGGGGAGF